MEIGGKASRFTNVFSAVSRGNGISGLKVRIQIESFALKSSEGALSVGLSRPQ